MKETSVKITFALIGLTIFIIGTQIGWVPIAIIAAVPVGFFAAVFLWLKTKRTK